MINEPELPPLPPQYMRPGKLRQEYYVDDVLRMAAIPGAVLAQQRPPVPQQLLPDRFGYDRTPLTIGDVVATDKWAPQWRSWTSGYPVNMRTAMGGMGPEGSTRNSQESMT